MISILYCPELNIFRITDMRTEKQMVKSEEELRKIGVSEKTINTAKAQPNEALIMSF